MRGSHEIDFANEAFEPNRARVKVDVGAFVQQSETVYRIVQVLDFESVIGIAVETGRSVPLRIGDLRPVSGATDAKLSVAQDLAQIADDDWRIAQQRFAAISPLVGKLQIGRDEAAHRAKEVNVNPATLYRWLQRYNAYGTVTALIPKKRGWQEGKSRIPAHTDAVIEQTIREGYDAEKHAAMTKSEFEAWLVTLICRVYHQRLHASIGMTPLKKWEIGIFGNGEVQGVGVPPRPGDRLTILLDFLPSFRRTVQTFGVTIDGMSYYAEALRPWINAGDSETGKKLELVFRRDPRDISAIWFFDPALKQYFKIPFADQALPAMSICRRQHTLSNGLPMRS